MRAFFWQESLVGGGSSDLPRSFLQIISFLRGHERPITRSYTLGAMWEILTNAHTSHQHCGLTWTLWGGLEGVYYSRPPPILFIKREAKMPKSTQAMPCHHLKRFLRLSPPSLVRKCTPQKCLPPRAPLFYPTCTPLLYVLPPLPPPTLKNFPTATYECDGNGTMKMPLCRYCMKCVWPEFTMGGVIFWHYYFSNMTLNPFFPYLL